MKLLTDKQKKDIFTKEIKVGKSYMFPRFGFTIYDKPNFASGSYMSTNPFTRSLDHELFKVRTKIDGFCKGNFENESRSADFYIHENELCRYDLVAIIFLFFFAAIPVMIVNVFRGGVGKIENSSLAKTVN